MATAPRRHSGHLTGVRFSIKFHSAGLLTYVDFLRENYRPIFSYVLRGILVQSGVLKFIFHHRQNGQLLIFYRQNSEKPDRLHNIEFKMSIFEFEGPVISVLTIFRTLQFCNSSVVVVVVVHVRRIADQSIVEKVWAVNPQTPAVRL